MNDTLRSRLAADGVVGAQAALVLALAHDLPTGVEVWATTSTVAELAARLETSPRTVRRWRQDLPKLSWCELTSTRQGYMLRIRPDGDDPSHTPARTSPSAPPHTPPRAHQPEVVTVEDARTLLGQIAATVRTLCGQYPAILDDLPGQDAAIMRSLIGQDAAISRPLAGQHEDITRPLVGHHAAIEGPDRGQIAATSHVHARTVTPRVHAPVTSRDIINNISDQSRPGLQASARTHEGTHAHEGLALPAKQGEVEVDEVVEQGRAELVERIQLKLVAGLDRYVQRPSAVEPGDVTDLAGQLIELLGDAAAARCYLDERLLSIADRAHDKRPTTWSYLARFLLQDATDPVIVARARAISQPVDAAAIETVTVAQAIAQAIQTQPRYSQPRPRRAAEAIVFEDIYPPSPPSTPQDELDAYRAELEYQLAQPPHLRDQATVDALLAELGMSSADLSAPVAPSAEIRTPVNRPVVLRDELPEASMVDADADEPPITPASGIPAHIRDQAAAIGLSFSSVPVAGPAPVAEGHLWARCIQAVGRLERGAPWVQRLERAGVRVDSQRRLLRIALESEAELEAWLMWSNAEVRVAIGERLEADTGAGWRVEAELLNAQEVGT